MEMETSAVGAGTGSTHTSRDLVRWAIAGASAGLTVDVSLYPLDTVKTRLQSGQGFFASGGFRNLYRGLPAVALFGIPDAAVFFLVYSSTKRLQLIEAPLGDAMAGAVAELTTSGIRVPIEVIKQRAQMGHGESLIHMMQCIYRRDGFRGFYRGLGPMIFREIPFSALELMSWEWLKREWAKYKKKDRCTPLESAIAGSAAGAFSAFVTNPFDVVKTRTMLADTAPTTWRLLLHVRREEGAHKLFAGAVPRTLWTSAGAFIFFFAYEFSLDLTYRFL